jgi:hypothetical protein
MTQQHLLPKFGSGKEAEGKATESVLTATEEDDGKDAEADGPCSVQSSACSTRTGTAARPEAEERKTNMLVANLNIEPASERAGSSLPGTKSASTAAATAGDVREPLPDGRGSDACHPSPLLAEPGASGSGSVAREQEEFPARAEPAERIAAKPAPRSGLVERLSRYAFWRRGKNPFRPKQTVRKRTAPVQGELLLEGVKVVRNDLNETDLEVVSSPKLPEKPAEPVESAESAANAEPARQAWRRIAARLLGGR